MRIPSALAAALALLSTVVPAHGVQEVLDVTMSGGVAMVSGGMTLEAKLAAAYSQGFSTDPNPAEGLRLNLQQDIELTTAVKILSNAFRLHIDVSAYRGRIIYKSVCRVVGVVVSWRVRGTMGVIRSV